jgi:hypothetical protein
MIPSFTLRPRFLDPDELRAASQVFDSALANLGGDETNPCSVRHELARFIIERSLDGERNADRLRAGAMEHAKLIAGSAI